MIKKTWSSTKIILAVFLIVIALYGQSSQNIIETLTMPGEPTILSPEIINPTELLPLRPNIAILRAPDANPVEPKNLNFPGIDTLYWHDYTPSSNGNTIRGYQAGFGVKLTPDYYPAIITGVNHRVFRLNSDSMQIRFVDDDGAGGAPQTNLYKVDTVTFNYTTSFLYHALPAPACTIWDGSFYLFLLGNTHNNLIFLLNWLHDPALNAPSGYHWRHDTLGIYSTWNPVGDVEMGAVVEYHDVSLDSISGLPANDTILVDSTYSIHTWSQEQAGFSEANIPVVLNFGGLFSDTGYLSLAPNGTGSAVLNWTVNLPEGIYSCTCYTALSSDTRKANDTLRFDIFVTVPVTSPFWEVLTPIPTTPSSKKPKAGTSMAGLNATGKIYLLKASNTQDFHIYTPGEPGTPGTFIDDSIPKGDKVTFDGKHPKKGASMAAYDPHKCLYVLRGNNTQGFWKYQADTLAGDTASIGWKKMPEIPLGAKAPKDASGMALVTKNDSDFLFVMKGSKTDEFYFYNIEANTWMLPAVQAPPAGTSGKIGYKKGSCLTYDGEHTVYVLKGNYGDFFKFDIDNLKWTELTRYDKRVFVNRDNKKKAPKDGAALVFHEGFVYMLKGGNTYELWKYNTLADTGTWVQMNPAEYWDVPLGSGKRVKGGGTMIKFGSYFYATKGGNTPEFYRHGLPAESVTVTYYGMFNQSTMDNKINSNLFKLTIVPNPAINRTTVRYSLAIAEPVNFKLYNVAGSLVKTYTNAVPTKNGSITINAKALPSGVYILRFNARDIKVTRKLVLEK